jgi:hypothetical protein
MDLPGNSKAITLIYWIKKLCIERLKYPLAAKIQRPVMVINGMKPVFF